MGTLTDPGIAPNVSYGQWNPGYAPSQGSWPHLPQKTSLRLHVNIMGGAWLALTHQCRNFYSRCHDECSRERKWGSVLREEPLDWVGLVEPCHVSDWPGCSSARGALSRNFSMTAKLFVHAASVSLSFLFLSS